MKQFLKFAVVALFAFAAAMLIAPLFDFNTQISVPVLFVALLLVGCVKTPAGVLSSKISLQGQQLMYEVALDALERAGYTKQGAILTQWSLRTEVGMAANTTSYNLPLTTQQANNSNIASLRLIKQTDVLIVYGVRVYVGVAGSASGALGRLYTYGNLTIFPTSTSAADINSAYGNGFLRLDVNKRQVLPAWDLMKHMRVPVTQQAADIDYTASTIDVLDSTDGSNDSFIPVAPAFVFSGDQDLELTLNIIAAQAITANSRWCVMFDGFLAQNTTKTANAQP